MTSKNLLRIALATATLSFGAMTFAEVKDATPAKGTCTPQNHHCKQADGRMTRQNQEGLHGRQRDLAQGRPAYRRGGRTDSSCSCCFRGSQKVTV
jgi:hypothetical protein